MNRDIVEGNWKRFKGKMQTQWSKLIGDHLGVIAGRRVQMAGERQRAYGVVCSRTLIGPGRAAARSAPSKHAADGAPPATATVMIVQSHENH